MSAGAGVELGGRALLRVLQLSICAVNQLWPKHDREVAGVVDRRQDVRDTDGGEVAACCCILECVSQELVAFASQRCEDALAAAEVVTKRSMTHAKFDRDRAKAQLVNTIAGNHLRRGCQHGRPEITVVILVKHTANLPVESCHWQDASWTQAGSAANCDFHPSTSWWRTMPSLGLRDASRVIAGTRSRRNVSHRTCAA